MAYADGTKVTTENSQADIRRALTKAKADRVTFGWFDDHTEVIVFRIAGDFYQVRVPHPPASFKDAQTVRDKELVTRYHNGYTEWPALCEREVRRRWRVALLQIKSRIELIGEGVEDAQTAFLPFLLLPSGDNLGERMRSAITVLRETGQMPDMNSAPALAAGEIDGEFREIPA